MRAVVQRVKSASVRVGSRITGAIQAGYLVLLGVSREDTDKDAQYLADKVAGLRIFTDEAGKFNLSISDIGGSVLVVSQFTLYGDAREGRRPSFTEAAGAELGSLLYEAFMQKLRQKGFEVRSGEFGAHMDVELINDGPVTILLDSSRQF
jgi:D-tyrosyl-tRNA(Tyr) deacylase